jgi:hypothetical protein
MNERLHHSERVDGTPSDLLFVRYTAAERHQRLAAAAQRRRLRQWCRA